MTIYVHLDGVADTKGAKMRIVEFTTAHIARAAQIAKQNYEEERACVPALPHIVNLPGLEDFAQGNRGVAAVEGEALLGFFCWLPPRENQFGLCKGTWSPTHAHGAVAQNRADIFDRLYQAAAERLVNQGVFGHSVTLYEHDAEASESFYQNGFGRRCVDAIRETAPIQAPHCDGVSFRQAGVSDAEAVMHMRNATALHLSQSPMFMPISAPAVAADTAEGIANGQTQCFIALMNSRPVAYLQIENLGEHFACDDKSVMNITGAYTVPQARGQGVSAALLSWLMDWLRERGYARCGVDFERFNYAARKFWLKYFTAYTNSVVRRVDERIAEPHK